MKAYIMRGMPGSGKTTFAKSLGVKVCSADDFHMVDGVYLFNPMKAAQAHAWCLTQFIEALAQRIDVCVANTAIHLWEFSAYLAAARLAGYEIEIHEFIPKSLDELKDCCKRNVHGVPLPVMLQMWYEYEAFPVISHGQ